MILLKSLSSIHIFNSFQSINFEAVTEYEDLKKKKYVGFAARYLDNFESKSHDQIDIHVYTKLVELDSRLGTTASEQLRWCLEFTSRSDIIKVTIRDNNVEGIVFRKCFNSLETFSVTYNHCCE